MTSLKMLLKIMQSKTEGDNEISSVYPGHGPCLLGERGLKAVGDYIAHREHRENQILEFLRQKRGVCSSMEITAALYRPVPSFTILLSAQWNVNNHLQKLKVSFCFNLLFLINTSQEENSVSYTSPDKWTITSLLDVPLQCHDCVITSDNPVKKQ